MASVRVRFTTRDLGLRVDDAPVYVPVDLKRFGLSEIVNQLLQTPEPVPFEFLVDGVVLRSSLEKYLVAQGLSTETLVTLEYVKATLPPKQQAAIKHDDWISSISAADSGLIASGAYDGVIRLWDRSANLKTQLVGHHSAVKALKWLSGREIVSGSSDHTLITWKLDADNEYAKPKASCMLLGHAGPVNDVLVLKSGLASASSDATIKVWTARASQAPPVERIELKNTASQKRQKTATKNQATSKQRGALATLHGHSAPVHGLAGHMHDDQVVYSVSEDHSIRTWDLTTSTLVASKSASFPLLSVVQMGPATGLLACGSAARHILLHDPREGVKTSQTQLTGHTNFVVALAKNPLNDYQFASGSHDGTARVWDVRALKSIATLNYTQEPENDVYALDWGSHLVFGGRQKTLQIYAP